MLKFDTIVKNGGVVIPYGDGVQNIDLGINDGKIAAYIDRAAQMSPVPLHVRQKRTELT